MSTGRTIQLTEAEDGWWVARDEEAGVTSRGSTRTEALENLDEAVARHDSGSDINPDASFWTAEPGPGSGRSDVSRNADEFLYGSRDDEENDRGQ